MTAAVLLIAVTAVWGVTFVQVKDAVAIYPLFAFLAVRYAIASAVLAPVAASSPARARPRRARRRGRCSAGCWRSGSALQTAGLERTTVTNTGFITGLYVLLTPLFALVLFRTRITRELWAAVVLALVGLALLAGVPSGSAIGDLLVLLEHGRAGAPDRDGRALREPVRPVGLTFVEIGVRARRLSPRSRSRSATSRCRTGRPSGPR